MGAPPNAYQAQAISHAYSLALREEQFRNERYTCFVRLRPDGMVNSDIPPHACEADFAVFHGHVEGSSARVLTDFL